MFGKAFNNYLIHRDAPAIVLADKAEMTDVYAFAAVSGANRVSTAAVPSESLDPSGGPGDPGLDVGSIYAIGLETSSTSTMDRTDVLSSTGISASAAADAKAIFGSSGEDDGQFYLDLSQAFDALGVRSGTPPDAPPSTGFPNGRRAGDDVTDVDLQAIVTSDAFDFAITPTETFAPATTPALDPTLMGTRLDDLPAAEPEEPPARETTFAEDEIDIGDLSFNSADTDFVL